MLARYHTRLPAAVPHPGQHHGRFFTQSCPPTSEGAQCSWGPGRHCAHRPSKQPHSPSTAASGTGSNRRLVTQGTPVILPSGSSISPCASWNLCPMWSPFPVDPKPSHPFPSPLATGKRQVRVTPGWASCTGRDPCSSQPRACEEASRGGESCGLGPHPLPPSAGRPGFWHWPPKRPDRMRHQPKATRSAGPLIRRATKKSHQQSQPAQSASLLCATCVAPLSPLRHPHAAADTLTPRDMALPIAHVWETARLAFKHRPWGSASPLPVLPFEGLNLSVLFPHLQRGWWGKGHCP